MGRLWQTLILSQWRNELAWLPVETLIHFQQTPSLTAVSLAVRLDISSKTIERHLKSLQLKERLRRVGPNKGGHWQVV